MLIQVEQGKGHGVILSHGWLFQRSRQLHRAVEKAAEVAGIHNRDSPQTLQGISQGYPAEREP
tara:strand:- start:211 stop:399 length:189 start_codon:yes stop_codon:yes gene_type:complete